MTTEGKMRTILGAVYHLLKGDSLFILKRRGLKVGKGFFHGSDCYIDTEYCWLITIGDDVTIVAGSYILAHDASTFRHLNYSRIGKVTIGNKVYIGAGSIILPGVTIGDNSIIGTGSVVTSDIPSRSVAVGNPARVIGTLDEFLARKREEMQIRPCFGREYTIAGKVDRNKKNEVIEKLKDGVVYIY